MTVSHLVHVFGDVIWMLFFFIATCYYFLEWSLGGLRWWNTRWLPLCSAQAVQLCRGFAHALVTDKSNHIIKSTNLAPAIHCECLAFFARGENAFCASIYSWVLKQEASEFSHLTKKEHINLSERKWCWENGLLLLLKVKMLSAYLNLLQCPA